MYTTFMSRKEAKKFRPYPNSAIVSIFTPGDKPCWLHPDWERIVRVQFYDVDAHSSSMIYPPISYVEAEIICKFIERCIANEIDFIAVHCDAGISRSAAVSMFLRDWYNATVVNPNWQNYNRTIYHELIRVMTDLYDEVKGNERPEK